MEKLNSLLDAVQALYPLGQVSFRGSEDRGQFGWVCTLSVGSVTLYESPQGTVDTVIDATIDAVSLITERMRKALLRQE